jgi:hypothetical protein
MSDREPAEPLPEQQPKPPAEQPAPQPRPAPATAPADEHGNQTAPGPYAGYAGPGGGTYAGYPGQSGEPYAGYAGPPPGYGPVAYAAPRTDDKAVWSLVSAIAGFLLCPIVLHIVGWVLADQSLRDIRSSQGRLSGDGIASTARILSIVGLVLYGLAAIIAILVFAILVPLGLLTLGTVAGNVDAGSRTVAPTSIEAIDGETFQHGVGDVTYDLGALNFTDRTVDMRIQISAGSLLVEVPDEVTVVLGAEIGAGELDAFGSTRAGVGITEDRTFDGEQDGGTLEIDINMGLGEVTLDRVG